MVSSKKYSFASRFNYWFDNRMAQGFWPKIRLLLLVTLAFILIMGGLAFIVPTSSDPDSHQTGGVPGFIRVIMYALGKGGALGTDEAASPIYFIILLLTILYCMFFTAILIGLINQGLRSKVEELGKGQGNVLENNHTLILGFNEAALVLIGELIQANENQRKAQPVVILGEIDRSAMIDQIKKRFGSPMNHPKTRIICRTGSPYDFDDLMRCSIESSRVVIVNASTDFESVKTIMACSHILKDTNVDDGPYMVAVMHGEENLVESKVAAYGNAACKLELLSLNDVLARIMVHTSRQPGLSDVFTELFNYADDEFYIIDNDPNFTIIHGRSIAQINHFLQMSCPVGVCKPSGEIVIGPPHDVVFEKGDSLIVVKRDDDALVISKEPIHKVELTPKPLPVQEQVRVLIIGIQPILQPVLKEYAGYLSTGSTIFIVGNQESFDLNVQNEVINMLNLAGINMVLLGINPNRKVAMDALLDETKPDSVLALVNQQTPDKAAEDERIMRMLIYLRDYRRRNHTAFSITCEMLDAHNKVLAATTEPDDFIISRQFASLLVAQISQNRNLAKLFNTVLASEGFEVYMKPASWYAPLGKPVDLISVAQSVADCDEVFIGIRQKINGEYRDADVNPMKFADDMKTLITYTFGPDDYLVVLAETSELQEHKPL